MHLYVWHVPFKFFSVDDAERLYFWWAQGVDVLPLHLKKPRAKNVSSVCHITATIRMSVKFLALFHMTMVCWNLHINPLFMLWHRYLKMLSETRAIVYLTNAYFNQLTKMIGYIKLNYLYFDYIMWFKMNKKYNSDMVFHK